MSMGSEEAPRSVEQGDQGMGGTQELQKTEKLRKELKDREQKYWSDFLGVKEVEVPELPNINLKVLERLSEDHDKMGIRALPKLDIGTLADLKDMGKEDVKAFLDRIQERYPGLHVGRLSQKSYWEKVRDDQISFPEEYNTGGWLAVELMPKPEHSRDGYQKTMISDKLGNPTRFYTSWNDAQAVISEKKKRKEVLETLGLPSDRVVRMLKIGEFSMLAPRKLVRMNGSKMNVMTQLANVGSLQVPPKGEQ